MDADNLCTGTKRDQNLSRQKPPLVSRWRCVTSEKYFQIAVFFGLLLLDISHIILSTVDFTSGLLASESECFYNSRVKFYEDYKGDLVPYELCCCNRQIFKEQGLELSDYSKDLQKEIKYRQAMTEDFSDGYKSEPLSKAELLHRSRCRAKRKIFDYIICNDFDCFITLTLDKTLIDRNDYSAVIKRLSSFLGNRVRRKGLIYVGVPELHKNGGLHFHFCVNSSAFKLSDSGTVSVPGKKKPIKVTTADKFGISYEERHTVYNITDWKLGFSTAILTYGSKGALACYMSKELNKDCQKRMAENGSIDKIGGRWYLSGGKLKKPVIQLSNRNFSEMKNFSYQIESEGGKFKFYKFSESGDVLP